MINFITNNNIDLITHVSTFPTFQAHMLHAIGIDVDNNFPGMIFGIIQKAYKEGQITDGLPFGSLITLICMNRRIRCDRVQLCL